MWQELPPTILQREHQHGGLVEKDNAYYEWATRCHDISKVNNSTIKGLRDSEVDEISNNELNTMMIRMINEIKDDV
jgi:hypothetical protein